MMNFSSINFGELTKWFSDGFKAIKAFEFSLVNPTFWLLFIILFLIVLKFWRPKKSFYFCLVIALILLGTTKAEKIIGQTLGGYGERFDPILLRIAAMFFIAITWLYNAFIKGDR